VHELVEERIAAARPKAVTSTLSIGTSNSAAMIIETAVVMPCPTSARGSAYDTVAVGVDGP